MYDKITHITLVRNVSDIKKRAYNVISKCGRRRRKSSSRRRKRFKDEEKANH
jgi:hypothetical protein